MEKRRHTKTEISETRSGSRILTAKDVAEKSNRLEVRAVEGGGRETFVSLQEKMKRRALRVHTEERQEPLGEEGRGSWRQEM